MAKKPPIVDTSTFTPDPSQLWNKPVTVGPPPQNPPKTSAPTFTPNPPPNLPPNVSVTSPAQAIFNRRIPSVSDKELVAAFKDKPLYVLDRVNWSRPNSLYRKRLENLIAQNPALKPILDYVLPVYPKAGPQPQVQPQAATPSAPPIITPAQTITSTQSVVGGPITAQTAPKIEDWMNGIKDHVYKSFAQNKGRDLYDSQVFTRSLLSSLALYRGGLASFYLDEGSKELIFSALGPLGDAFRSLYEKDIKRKMAWMKNPLNPDAINYYLTSLPNQMAFKLLYLPAKASFGILARGGAPLISKVTYGGSGKPKTSYVFTPLLRATQISNKLADSIDKYTGQSTDFIHGGYDKYIKTKNIEVTEALNNYQRAKKNLNSLRFADNKIYTRAKRQYKIAQKELKLFVDENDGFFRHFSGPDGKTKRISKLKLIDRAGFGIENVFRATISKGLGNTARRLRQHHRDPISFLFALIGGAIWDLTIGLGLNILRVAATKFINLIPGVPALRAQLTEFLTSNSYISTARIGGATMQSFVKGVFSPTTLTSGYLGYRFGSLLTPNLYFNLYGVPINVGGALATPIFAGAGAFYNTALKMSFTQIPGWVQEFQMYKGATMKGWALDEGATWGDKMIKDNYLKGFKPGPISNFASWLSKHPYAKLPINGFVVGDFMSSFMQARFGWNPWITRFTFAGGDYIWQVKGTIAKAFTRAFSTWFPKTFVGRIFTESFEWLTKNVFSKPIAWQNTWLGKLPTQWAIRPFWQGLKNFWSAAQPYVGNFFNPGFFMGFGLTSLLAPTMGAWAYLAGPVLGSAAWLAGSKIIASTLGYSSTNAFSAFLSRVNPLAYTGFFIAQLTGLFAFGTSIPFWYTAIWTIGLPLIGTIIQTVAWSLGYSTISAFLGTGLSIITNGLISIAAGTGIFASTLAIWATITSIVSVVGLTIFSVYTIYSGFWIPMVEESQAVPRSSNFTINTDVQKIGPNKYKLCSSFDIIENVFNLERYLIHNFDFRQSSYLTVNLSDPDKVTDAWLGQKSLDYIAFTPDFVYPHYTIPLPLIDPPIVGYQQIEQLLETYLPTPDANIKNLQTLMYHDQSIVSSMSIYFDTLKDLAQENGQTPHVIQGYEAQLALLKTQQKTEEIKQQIKLLDDFITQLINAKKKITSPTLAQTLIDTNFYSLADSNLSVPEKDVIWNLLANFFPNVFKNTSNFYIFPIGTNYKVCVDADYCYAIDPNNPPSCPTGQPITICSTISYKPSFWSPNTAFAKSCSTFTP